LQPFFGHIGIPFASTRTDVQLPFLRLENKKYGPVSQGILPEYLQLLPAATILFVIDKPPVPR